jgi:hypothetical protein
VVKPILAKEDMGYVHLFDFQICERYLTLPQRDSWER